MFFLLIVPDSAHMQYTPITLGTLHIDMTIKKELENLNKQWKRSLMVTKLTMKEAQIVGVNDEHIISKIDNVLKLARNTTISPFRAIEVKDIIKTPNHYKCVNVVVDNLPEKQLCKDITVVQKIQTLKPGSNKLNVEADALSRIPWENTQVDHLEPLIVQTTLQSKLETEMGIPEKVFTIKCNTKGDASKYHS